LLPQYQNLGLKRSSRPEKIREHPPDQSAQVQHHATASPDSQSTTSRIWFAVGTADYYNGVQTHRSLNDDAPEELGRFLATIGSPDRLAEHRTRKKSSTAIPHLGTSRYLVAMRSLVAIRRTADIDQAAPIDEYAR